MEIIFKKNHKDAVIPSYAHNTDAGADMVAISMDETDKFVSYDTGISLKIPTGFAGFIFPRSSISKKDLLLCNSVGVIDSSYRGSISFRFQKVGDMKDFYKIGDRLGQLIILPFNKIIYKEGELDETERGKGGYGSTGH